MYSISPGLSGKPSIYLACAYLCSFYETAVDGYICEHITRFCCMLHEIDIAMAVVYMTVI